MATFAKPSLHWRSRLFNFIVWIVGTPVRRQNSQGLLEELRDGKDKYLNQKPPESLLKTTQLVASEETIGQDRLGSRWTIWHLGSRKNSLSNQVVIFFHGGGLYIGVSLLYHAARFVGNGQCDQ